ncbi:MAG: GAP family protein [Candidatus ainarchaeum sp.]|nr:GAP family protein [Candidatus ainarchaeum sp.]
MIKKIFVIMLFLLLILNVQAQGQVNAIFFWGDGCPHCAAADNFLKTIEEEYDFLEIERLNINQNVDFVLELYDLYDVDIYERGAVPILFIGEKYFLGDNQIINNFEKEVLLCFEEECELLNASENVEPAKEEFSIITILGLAIVDAVNPCELAVLIILMTAILAKYPKQKSKALKAGLLFSLAIFLMYFVFGILIITGFKFLTQVTSFSGNWFFTVLGIIAVILGILNLKDAIWYGGACFIMEVPQKWRPKMKSIISGTTSPKGAFVVGLIVSFFLTPCTAGPYFVAGGILSNISWVVAIPTLLLYMIIFISPMIAITIITYFGFAKVEDMGGWRERNLKKLHLIAGLIM